MEVTKYPQLDIELPLENGDTSPSENELEVVSGEDRAGMALLEMCYYDEYGEMICGPAMEHTAKPISSDEELTEAGDTGSHEVPVVQERSSIRKVTSHILLREPLRNDEDICMCVYDEYGKMICGSGEDLESRKNRETKELVVPKQVSLRGDAMRRVASHGHLRKIQGAGYPGSYFYDEYGQLVQRSTWTPPSPDASGVLPLEENYAKVLPTIKASKIEKIRRAGSHSKLNSTGQQSPPSRAQNQCLKHPRHEKVTVKRGSDGKIGVKIRRMASYLYFAYVEKGSPAAAAGIGFGDQLLEFSGYNLTGASGSRVEHWLKESKQTELQLTVVKRPYDFDLRGTVTPQGDLIYSTKLGKRLGTVKLSKVLHKGHLKHLQLLSVNSKPILCRSEAEITDAFKGTQDTFRLRVMPRLLADHLTKQLDKTSVRDCMQLSQLKN